MKCSTARFFVCIVFLTSCSAAKKIPSASDDLQIELTLVQINDVYEIAPIENGTTGGMARVATIKNEELKKNKNTWLIMAGDFFSPSVYNSLKYQGRRIRGKQMIDAMNAAGVDLAVFGNHEFDITESEFQERLNESEFQWVSSNVLYKKKDSIVRFAKTIGVQHPLPESLIVEISDADGTTARIGLIGITIPSNTASYVHYTDPLETAKQVAQQLRDSCDAVIAVTHQLMRDDVKLAKQLPWLPIIMGGHEHDGRFEKVGNVLITKAYSNARSAYVTKLRIDKKNKKVSAEPVLKQLDTSVAIDLKTDSVVKKWTAIANNNYALLGFNPAKLVLEKGDALEGRETRTRIGATNLTDLIVKSMTFACPKADMAIVNAGSIRLDDILYPPVSEYDILRTLPFGGSIREVDMKGSLLDTILAVGKKNMGGGGFLHSSPAISIEPEKVYRVALSDYLLTGAEINLGFLTTSHPSISKVYPEETSPDDPRSDIRLAIIKYLLQ